MIFNDTICYAVVEADHDGGYQMSEALMDAWTTLLSSFVTDFPFGMSQMVKVELNGETYERKMTIILMYLHSGSRHNKDIFVFISNKSLCLFDFFSSTGNCSTITISSLENKVFFNGREVLFPVRH